MRTAIVGVYFAAELFFVLAVVTRCQTVLRAR